MRTDCVGRFGPAGVKGGVLTQQEKGRSSSTLEKSIRRQLSIIVGHQHRPQSSTSHLLAPYGPVTRSRATMLGFISGFWASKYIHPALENASANLDRKEPVAEEKPAASVVVPNQTTKPKPCCVCKEEKATRDDCMLFSKSDDPASGECLTYVQKYKDCMAGFGFKV
ncbi:uncharacterized protein TERG_02083 [Trichophyton rubrum CBS 118892]|uniref:Cytochrome c oxidase copper chaperone Cox17 n=1 Tax=Trichophyton rubrum (strain ATCC MYA-4607 / CBS 118892) TaxID=559305 RepID=F2SJA0_TRIRC|nr:uncharacterized protein TERG_02083 [Trichophyton rubrum CBS 118892]EGD85813.2 hypothetical protein TERG_02083 [Trichophyton rubrum CBS 118892]